MTGARVLWVGGTSALARTYFEECHPARGVSSIIAAAPWKPAWSLPKDVAFVELNLSSQESVRSLFERLPHGVDSIIFGVRASLVYGTPEEHEMLSNNLELLLRSGAAAGVTSVLHISSIAVADHVTSQHMIRETDPVPPLEQIASPYDRFKLRSEHVVDTACSDLPGVKVWTHLRISGIFSNDPRCIQCTAIRRQALVSLATTACIDFNSSRNVGHAIALVLERQHAGTHPHDLPSNGSTTMQPTGRQLYYYTRCTREPAAYWHHVADYRRANGLWYGLWLPGWVADLLVPLMRKAMEAIGTDFAKSLDYLMAVASHEHSADNSAFRTAFPDIQGSEESIFQCFLRLRNRQDAQRREHKKNLHGTTGGCFLMLMMCLGVAVAVALMAAESAWGSMLAHAPPPPAPRGWWHPLASR